MKTNHSSLTVLISAVLIMNAHSYTNPINGQMTEVINNDSWILPEAYLYVGGTTWGNGMIITNAGYVESEAGYLGFTDAAFSNSVLVTGTGSVWTNIYHVHIGSSGSFNTLQIKDGGSVYNMAAAIGASPKSNNNIVRVTDEGSLWSSSDYLYIGHDGSQNKLEISNGAQVLSQSGNLGWNSGANNNSVLVTDQGTIWSNDYRVLVGLEGSGNTLIISNAASVFNTQGTLGNAPASSNNMSIVTGTGSTWHCAGDLYVGEQGSGNRMTIGNGASVDNNFSRIGHKTDSTGNSVLVTGTGSVFINRVLLLIGNNGAENHLTIADGGSVKTLLYGAAIGQEFTSTNNSVEVTGPGSSWYNNGNIFIGERGSGNTLSITEGAHTENFIGTLGGLLGSDHNTALVSGSGSIWTNRAFLVIGNSGSDNCVTVTNGGKIYSVLYGATLGAESESNNNILEINGSGSLLHCQDNIYVGQRGKGNRFSITNGATAIDHIGFVGRLSGADGNSAIVSGSGSIWSNTSNLSIGESGSYNTLCVSNGASIFNTYGAIGSESTAQNNSVTVTGEDSRWINSEPLFIGTRGSYNVLHIAQGGFVENERYGIIGAYPESNNNAVFLTGSNTLWQCNGALTIGENGSDNEVFISHGARVENTHSSIGRERDSNGNSVSLTGNASEWINSEILNVGFEGSDNELSIIDGASLKNDQASIGEKYGADNNSVLISGSGSTWTNQSLLWVGNNGSENQLTISDGGKVVTMQHGSVIGNDSACSNNTVLVTGSESTWNIHNDLHIGSEGSSNLLTVADGARVVSSSGVIGIYLGADINSALISGPGSTWSNAYNLVVGFDGFGNNLTITNGASVINEYANIGAESTSDFNSVLVTGTASVWSNRHRFNVGEFGSDNTLIISNNASVYSLRASIGDNPGSDRNKVLVHDAQLTTEEELKIGGEGSENNLTISNRGVVASKSYGTIGFGTNSINNSVSISGIASVWYCGDHVSIGGFGSNNSMLISLGGDVRSPAGCVGYFPSSFNNVVTVSGSGSLWECWSALYVGGSDEGPGGTGNSVTVSDGATVQTGLLTVYPSNVFHAATGGKLEVSTIDGDLLLDGILEQTGAQCNISGDLTMGCTGKITMDPNLLANEPGPLHLTISGMAALNGTFELKGGASVAWSFGTYDLIDYSGGVSGSFHSFLLPNLIFGHVWNTDYLHTTGELIIEPDIADTNANGIEDGWEYQYFGYGISPTNNPDSDLLNNLEEFIAGTDPTNAASYFCFTNATPDATGFVVEWDPSISNRLYNVTWSTNLTTSFLSLETGIEYPRNSCTDTVHTAENQCFYQVEVQLK